MSSYIPRSLLDQARPEAADLTYRMSMLPFGTYPNADGSGEHLGFAVPGMIEEPMNALMRLIGTPSNPGTFTQGPDYGSNSEDMRTLLETFLGGNATRGMGAGDVAARALSDTTPSLPGAVVAGAERNAPIRAYRGSGRAYDLPGREESFFSSSSPEVAASYAEGGPSAAMMPVDLKFSNPMIVDANGNLWDRVPYNGSNYETNDLMFMAKNAGHDGLVVHNVIDDSNEALNPATTYAALKRGTVTSPLTGETLFSNGLPSLWGAAVQGQEPSSRTPMLDQPPAIITEQPGLSRLQSFASGGNVADTSGLSGLRSIPDYGFGPMTPTTQAGYPNTFVSSREPDPTWGDYALSAAEFPARAMVNQFNAATSGVSDAIANPSLANLTNAGVQTGLAVMSPELAVGSGLGGLGLAALQDANIIPSAEARSRHRVAPSPMPETVASAPEVDPVLEKIKDDPSLMALYQQIKVEQNNATRDYPGRNGDASRAAAAARVQELQGQFSDALAKRDAVKQGIYDQQVQNALAARDAELGRDRRFSDTAVGKVYDKLGGYAPLVAGFVPGVVSRLAYGPAQTFGNALMRDLEGATFGVGANNVPLAYNAFATEVDNPEQRAYATYAYNLPEGHPDKLKAQQMADTLPKLNPVRTGAAEELYDPMKFGERAAMGAMEGWGGNRLGQMFTPGVGGIFRPSSYKLPPEAPIASGPAGPALPAQPGAAAKLLADTQTVLPESSDLIGPATSRSLPALADVADTVPVSSAPARKPRGGRRSKSAGSKTPADSETALPTLSTEASPLSPDAQAAAADELKQFLGFRLAPTLKDKGFATGGRVLLDEAVKSVSRPTDGQKEAGNYKKAHVRFHGLDIAIENPRGSERAGVDKGGKRWAVNMPDHYGYIKRTEGRDGDHVDCYIGPNESSTKVFVVDQKDAGTGKFDEHKCMLGYASKEAALDAYKRAFSDGKGAERIGHVASLSMDEFKNWLRNGDTTRPTQRQKFASGGVVRSEDHPVAGPLHAATGGRTDVLPIDVAAGSYVVPADIVSALGEGNTNAGTRILGHMFPEQAPSLHYAAGGKVPIIAAGGEHVLSPDQVAAVGGGDLNRGHEILDQWVRNTRNDTIKTLKSLPGPQT